MTDNLATAIDATLARMRALQEAKDQLERRRQAIRALHFEDGMPRAEIAREMYNSLRERGLSSEQLVDAGVTHASIEKVFRPAK